MSSIPIIVLSAVFILIAIRQVFQTRLRIWQIMLSGALAVLLTGQISMHDAVLSINPDVMLFLFGMFVVGAALEESGYLSHLSYLMFRRAKNVDQLIFIILFGMGILSALLMNDTLAIIGTPLVLHFAAKYGISPKLLLLSLAFGITTGSVMSPIGNPQNLLIAIEGDITNPFITFFSHLAIPTFINLFIAYLLLRKCFHNNYLNFPLNHTQEPIIDHNLALISRISLMLLFILVFAKIAAVFTGIETEFKLTYIALISASPILMLSRRRLEIIQKVDWNTLIFFASMFILMTAVWDSGFFQSLLAKFNLDIADAGIILAITITLSQLLSNVPLVALYLPVLTVSGATTQSMMAMAAGSTIAGNLLILGAASNVIIIQNAEKKSETLTFFEFARVGVPLTIANAAVYWIFLIKI